MRKQLERFLVGLGYRYEKLASRTTPARAFEAGRASYRVEQYQRRVTENMQQAYMHCGVES